MTIPQTNRYKVHPLLDLCLSFSKVFSSLSVQFGAKMKTKILLLNFIWFVIRIVESDEKMTNVRQDEAPQKTNLTTENCDFNENCVRFCCDDNSACLNETFFNLNLTKEAKNLNLSFKVLSGRPKCGSMFEEDEGIWEFLSDGKVVQIVDDARFVNDHTQYCFDRTNDKNRMLICYGDEADQNEEDEIPSEAIYPICENFKLFLEFKINF